MPDKEVLLWTVMEKKDRLMLSKTLLHLSHAKKTKNDPEENVSWCNQEVRSRAQQAPAVQIRKVQEGVVPEASSAVTPNETFSLFLSDGMLEGVVKRTNTSIDLLIDSVSEEFLVQETLQNNRMLYMEHTNLTEFKALIRLIYLRGLLCLNMWETDRLFEDEIGHPVFAATMS